MKNILRTFEIFLSLPMSIFCRKFVHIMHIEDTKGLFKKQAAKIDVVTANGSQITVTNNLRVYSLLSNVIQRKKMQYRQTKNEIQFCALTVNRDFV